MQQVFLALLVFCLAFTACSSDSDGLSKADVVSILETELSKDSLRENSRDSVFVVKRDTVISIVNNRDTIITIIGGGKDTLLLSSKDTIYIRDTVLWGGSENDVARSVWLSPVYKAENGLDSVYEIQAEYYSNGRWLRSSSDTLSKFWLSFSDENYDPERDSILTDFGSDSLILYDTIITYSNPYSQNRYKGTIHVKGRSLLMALRDTCISEYSAATGMYKFTIRKDLRRIGFQYAVDYFSWLSFGKNTEGGYYGSFYNPSGNYWNSEKYRQTETFEYADASTGSLKRKAFFGYGINPLVERNYIIRSYSWRNDSVYVKSACYTDGNCAYTRDRLSITSSDADYNCCLEGAASR